LVARLKAGQSVVIGPCTLLQQTVIFRTGFIIRKEHRVPWQDVETEMHNGHVYVMSRTDRDTKVSMPAKDTDNGVVLPILSAMIKKESDATPIIAGQQPNQGLSYTSSILWAATLWRATLVVIVGSIVLGIAIHSSSSTTKMPRGGSHTPPSIPSRPAYGPIPPYRPPSVTDTIEPAFSRPSVPDTTKAAMERLKAELNRERQTIDCEKARAEQMERELDSLSREIDQERMFVDRTNHFSVDQFNRKVAAHNELLERLRDQDRLINQLVERYNAKIRQQGR
jgi:hypothetical protein